MAVTKKKERPTIAPQAGAQADFLACRYDVVFYGGAAGCVDKDTEFLSESGWKKINDYKDGDKVLQFNPATNIAEFIEPVSYIKLPEEYLTHFQAKGVDQCLSDEHRVLYYNENGSYHTKPFAVIRERHQKSKTKGFTGKFKTTFEYGGSGIDLSDGELRLQVAVMADGRVVNGGKDNYTQMRFSKKRKYDRLLELCQRYGLEHKDNGFRFNEKYSNKTEYEIIVWPRLSDKEFDNKYYQCSAHQLAIIFDEVFHWDGTFVDNVKTSTKRYFTKHKHNADFIQFVSASQGYNSTISEDLREGKQSYTVNCMSSGNGFRGIANKDGKIPMTKFKTVDGYKYCFTVPTGYFVIRRNDKICVTGNSGKSHALLMDALQYMHDPDFNAVYFRQNTTQLDGSLWPEAKSLYTQFGGVFKERDKTCTFPSGAKIKFSYMELL